MAYKPSNDDQTTDPADLSFSVMPHGDTGDYVSGQMKSAALPQQTQAPAKQIPNPEPAAASQRNAVPVDSGHGLPVEHDHPGLFQRRSTYIILGILILLVLGGGAYFLLGPTDSPSQNQPASKLPKVFLMKYFNTESCTQQALCGDTADPDNDGLQNYDEFVEQATPNDNDSDDDGLSDGDEVHIFKTNPLKKFTDPRPVAEEMGYTDASQVKNDYDPNTPGLKMTETRLNQINSDMQSYGVHEPTKTTLSAPAATAPTAKTVTVSIINNKFDNPNLVVNVNDTVVWLNKDAAAHQIASDPHPTHTGLVGLESGSLSTNQTYSFKFTKAGKFGYHDHLNPSIKGTVEVK